MKKFVALTLLLCMVLSLAACTEAYDPYADAESALTVYVKWIA